MQCSNDHKLRPRAILDPQTPMFLMLKTPTLQNVISVKNDFLICVYRFTSDKPGCMLHPYLCNIYWKYFLSHHLFDYCNETSKVFSYKFIENSDILCCLQSLLFNNFFHQFSSSLSLKKMTSAVCYCQ